jgi:hypothetical protein
MGHKTVAYVVDELEIGWLHGVARRLETNLIVDPSQTVDGSMVPAMRYLDLRLAPNT